MTLMCSGLVISPSSQAGSCGRTPQAASTASGNFAGMRGRQHDVGNARIRGVAVGHRQRHRGVGIDEIAGLAPGGADRRRGLGFIGAPGVEFLADRGQHRIGQHEPPGLLQRRPSDRRTLAASRRLASNSSRSKFEEIWMSIDGDAVACTSRTS